MTASLKQYTHAHKRIVDMCVLSACTQSSRCCQNVMCWSTGRVSKHGHVSSVVMFQASIACVCWSAVYWVRKIIFIQFRMIFLKTFVFNFYSNSYTGSNAQYERTIWKMSTVHFNIEWTQHFIMSSVATTKMLTQMCVHWVRHCHVNKKYLSIV